jgi:hypothetical protein
MFLQPKLLGPVALSACFAALAASSAALRIAWRPAEPDAPHDLAALAPYLSECGFEEYQVRPEIVNVHAGEEPLAGGFYLVAPGVTVDPRVLRRDSSQARAWHGILACGRYLRPDDILKYDLEAWGDCAYYTRGFLFFGDPEEVAKVRALLPQY